MTQTGGETLLSEIAAFCRRYDLAVTQFGAMAVRSPSLVASLKNGRRLRPETERRIRAFIANGDPRARSRGSRTARAYARAKARNIRFETAARQFRAADPVEQAKTHIRTRGWACFEAEITRPAEIGKFFIGARLVGRDELLRFARRHGWEG